MLMVDALGMLEALAPHLTEIKVAVRGNQDAHTIQLIALVLVLTINHRARLIRGVHGHTVLRTVQALMRALVV